MGFDIYQLDDLDLDIHEDQEYLEDYQDQIIELFVNSPDGQKYLERNSDIGGWIGHLIYYGYAYEGVTLPRMTKNELKIVLESLFPRKISLFSPDEADSAIPELIAFWQFLHREYQLRNAPSILKYLKELQPNFPTIMNDPSKFGMAKSFFMMGQEAGFDLTTQEGLNDFTLHYNTNVAPKLVESQTDLTAGLFSAFNNISNSDQGEDKGLRSISAAKKAKQKKLNNMAKAARKRNRQKRK